MEARIWTLKTPFEGLPTPANFELITEILPILQDDEILAKAEYWSVDPYMRSLTTRKNTVFYTRAGMPLPGAQVARIVESRNEDFPVGILVYGGFGWRDLTIFKPSLDKQNVFTLYKLPELYGLPASYALGAMGMPGIAALIGLWEVLDPKEGETLVVSSGAGCVGSIVGQLAKLKGCNVIGFAGTEEKLKLMKEFGFDRAINYKQVDINEACKEVAPDGVHCFFDTIGGEFMQKILQNMRKRGRVAICGAITTYNEVAHHTPLMADPVFLIYNEIKIEGFLALRWENKWMETVVQLRDMIISGDIKVRETVLQGFEVMPQAFIDLFNGKNIGKQIIKA